MPLPAETAVPVIDENTPLPDVPDTPATDTPVPAEPFPDTPEPGPEQTAAPAPTAYTGRNYRKYPVFSATYPSRRLNMEGDPDAWAEVPGEKIEASSSPLKQMLGN